MINTKLIKKMMLYQGITTQSMCKELHIRYHDLILILDKDYPPTWEHLCRIATMIGMNPIDLIVKEGEHEQDRNRAKLKAPEEVS